MKVLTFATAIPLLALVVGLSTAQAAPPPRVDGYACRTLKASMPVADIWSAAFYGGRVRPFNQIEYTHQVRCFRTEASCKAWLYWIQTDWRETNMVRRCRVGKPY